MTGPSGVPRGRIAPRARVVRFLPTFQDVRDGAVGLVVTAVSLGAAARTVHGWAVAAPAGRRAVRLWWRR